jgi:N,N'-diacetyllegionaminate synthase
MVGIARENHGHARMRIADRLIDGERGAFVIAEVAQAHDGSLGYAHAFIDAAADAGADAIKFQTHIADAESTLDEQFRVQLSGQDATRWDYWRRMEFTRDQWAGLAEHATRRKLVFLSSPFSPAAVDLLASVGIPAWKVGSGEAFNHTLIDLMLDHGGPILLSTGMSNWGDITDMVAHIHERGGDVALFQCASRYPTSLEKVGINVVGELRRRFALPVGLSDHSGTPWPALASLVESIDFLEVHVTFDKSMYGPDTSSSLTFTELAMVTGANRAFATMRANPVDKDQAAADLAQTKTLFTKSLSPVRDLPAGTLLNAEMLTAKKPGGGLTQEQLSQVLGRRLYRDVPANRLLRLDDLI